MLSRSSSFDVPPCTDTSQRFSTVVSQLATALKNCTFIHAFAQPKLATYLALRLCGLVFPDSEIPRPLLARDGHQSPQFLMLSTEQSGEALGENGRRTGCLLIKSDDALRPMGDGPLPSMRSAVGRDIVLVRFDGIGLDERDVDLSNRADRIACSLPCCEWEITSLRDSRWFTGLFKCAPGCR